MARLDIFGDGTGRNVYALSLSGPELYALHRALRSAQAAASPEQTVPIRLQRTHLSALADIVEALHSTTDDVPRLRET